MEAKQVGERLGREAVEQRESAELRQVKELLYDMSVSELRKVKETARQLLGAAAALGEGSTEWNYQRQTWTNGWLQNEPRPHTLKNGQVKVYGYWVFRWIEDGKQKSKYIGSDEKLHDWKARNPR